MNLLIRDYRDFCAMLDMDTHLRAAKQFYSRELLFKLLSRNLPFVVYGDGGYDTLATVRSEHTPYQSLDRVHLNRFYEQIQAK